MLARARARAPRRAPRRALFPSTCRLAASASSFSYVFSSDESALTTGGAGGAPALGALSSSRSLPRSERSKAHMPTISRFSAKAAADSEYGVLTKTKGRRGSSCASGERERGEGV